MKRTRKRRDIWWFSSTMVVVALLLSTTLLAACGPTAEPTSAPEPTAAEAVEPTEAAEPAGEEIPDNLKGSGEVVIGLWGGAMQDAQREAIFKSFEELTGITVREVPAMGTAELKAAIDSGSLEMDVMQTDSLMVLNLNSQGEYFLPVDYSYVDVDNIDASHRQEYWLGFLPYAGVIGYRTDVFSEEDHPSSWAEFWDTEKYPGPRTLPSAEGGMWPPLEYALMADGVPLDQIYPIDIDRAFNAMSRIRPDVVKWWDASAIPAQLLSDGEVVAGAIWNGRAAAAAEGGAPIAIEWNQAMLLEDVWAIPASSQNLENAQKFIGYASRAAPQARLSSLITYGFTNNKAAELLPEERLKMLPTNPELQGKTLLFNSQWWADNINEVVEKWSEWILEE